MRSREFQFRKKYKQWLDQQKRINRITLNSLYGKFAR
jgi:hypothetical protein